MTISQSLSMGCLQSGWLIPMLLLVITCCFLILVTGMVWQVCFLIWFLQGMGDSCQGFANFLLFCLFTKKFRSRLQKATCDFFQQCKKQPGSKLPSSSEETRTHQPTVVNESTSLLGSIWKTESWFYQSALCSWGHMTKFFLEIQVVAYL